MWYLFEFTYYYKKHFVNIVQYHIAFVWIIVPKNFENIDYLFSLDKVYYSAKVVTSRFMG